MKEILTHCISMFLVFSPPILEGVSNGTLMEMIDSPDIAKEHLNLPNHTQQVERGIKDLAFVAERHAPEERDAVLKIIGNSREQMPSNKTKKDYNHFVSDQSTSNDQSNSRFDQESDYSDSDPDVEWTDGF